MNNQWNGFIYKWWAPFYDLFFNKGIFYEARKQVFQDVLLETGKKVLLVGAGTGADLAFIPYHNLHVTAIDYSEEMLQKAEKKYSNGSIQFLQMDAQQLAFDSETFDFVVASLVLSVVPNPEMVLKEIARVTTSGGEILIFDKFVPLNGKLSIRKRLIRPVVKLLGTDIGVSFENIFKPIKTHCQIHLDKDVMMKGMYRKIMVKKTRV